MSSSALTSSASSCYIDSVRINLGLFQHDVNVVWDLGPSRSLDHRFPPAAPPGSLSAFGACQPRARTLEDVAYLNLDFGEGLLATLHVTGSPGEGSALIVGGSKKSIVYNDLDQSEKVRVYDRGITTPRIRTARRAILIGYRTGDVWSPNIRRPSRCSTMVRHFAQLHPRRRSR